MNLYLLNCLLLDPGLKIERYRNESRISQIRPGKSLITTKSLLVDAQVLNNIRVTNRDNLHLAERDVFYRCCRIRE